MNRRTLLKQLAMSSTAAFLLPSCLLDNKKVSLALSNLKVSGEEEELLGLMADTILPETDTPGARTLKAHQFALVMVDDCKSKEEQETYLAGMRAFDDACKSLTGSTFLDATVAERVSILTQLEENKQANADNVNTFYFTTKGFIVQGYLSSQHFLTNVKKYELVPGPDFKGCVPVSENPKTA